MKSLDTLVESFKKVWENPKIVLVPFGFYLIQLVIGAIMVALLLGSTFNFSFFEFLSNPTEALLNFSKDLGKLFAIGMGLIIFAILWLIISFSIFPLLHGILISAGKQAKKEKNVDLKKAFEEAKQKYFSLLGIYLIILGILAFIVIISILMVVFSFVVSVGMGIAVFLILLIISLSLGVVLGVWFFEAPVLVFTENKGAIEAIKRSIFLGNKKFLSILASIFFYIISAIAINVVFQIVSFPLQVGISFSFLSPTALLFTGILLVLFGLIGLAISAFLFAVYAILPVNFYYNYDLEKV
jgi:hypothetical protein